MLDAKEKLVEISKQGHPERTLWNRHVTDSTRSHKATLRCLKEGCREERTETVFEPGCYTALAVGKKRSTQQRA